MNKTKSSFRAVACGLYLLCGLTLHAQLIQWIQLPVTGGLAPNPTGSNPAGTWIVTNLPCYGPVLVTHTFPVNVTFPPNPHLANVPNSWGQFINVQPGYGPYSWGLNNGLGMFTANPVPHYTVNYYFLNGPPNISSLYVAIIGLEIGTTADLSQTVVYRGEYDLYATNTLLGSANTTISGVTNAGTVGTHVGSAGNAGADPRNTGWAFFQPTTNVFTANLPTGTGMGYPPSGVYPCLSLSVNQQGGDGIGFSLGYVCGSGCVQITNQTVACVNTNQAYLWSFCVTNNFTNEIQYLSIPNPPAGVTFSEDIIKLPVDLNPGQGACVSLYVTNQSTNATICFTMGAHNTNFFACCSFSNCLTFAPCCAFVSSEKLQPIAGSPNCYSYTVTLENTTTNTIQYVSLIPDSSPCLSFNKDIITLSPPLQPNQSATFTTTVCITRSTTCLGPYCFMIALANSNFVQCCSTEHCLRPLPVPIVVTNPANGSVFSTPVDIGLGVTLDTNVSFTSVTYLANGQPVASSSGPPFSAVWSNAPAGQYDLTANGADSTSGGVWSSDPVTIYVLNPITNSIGGPVSGPQLSTVKCIDNGLSFCFVGAPGVTYYVETSSSLISPAWSVTQIVPGDGSMITVTNAVTTDPQRFYRVRVGQ
jgi:hypothetical protein